VLLCAKYGILETDGALAGFWRNAVSCSHVVLAKLMVLSDGASMAPTEWAEGEAVTDICLYRWWCKAQQFLGWARLF
jgi:hypothetical protein